VGKNAIIAVKKVMKRGVIFRGKIRPYLSPRKPNKIAPIGLAKNPIAKTP